MLCHGIRSVLHHIHHRYAFFAGIRHVHYIIPCGQDAYAAQPGQFVQYPGCQGRLVGNHDIGICGTCQNIIVTGAVIYCQIAQ